MHGSYDVIIAGLGAMGSAAAYHLAKRKCRVLGLDRFAPPHEFGSSHGHSRIIREAYFEHPVYVPLVQRAYKLWAELEKGSLQKLFQQTGGLMIGPPDGVLVAGAKHSAEVHNLPYEVLKVVELRDRFPAFRPRDNMVGLWEPHAGILFPEKCIEAHLDLAQRRGAELHFDEIVAGWRAEGKGVIVTTTKGNYRAARLILTVGAWMSTLLRDLHLPLTVKRQVLLWFQPAAAPKNFSPERFPIFILEYGANRQFYGFPDLGNGVKIAIHHQGETAAPEKLRREVDHEEVDKVRELLRCFIPHVDGVLLNTAVCMYTNTPDFHFLIDAHPTFPQVLIVSPCSGHGFKFSSAIGEALADLITAGQSFFDLSMFQLKRFAES
jgi:sarcosine oxidase